MTHRRSTKLLASLFAFSLLATACSDDDPPATSDGGTEDGSTESTAPREVAQTVTYTINPDAVWDDGTAITFADFQCTFDASLNTPGSILTAGYDKVIEVAEGAGAGEVVVTFFEPYAPFRNLFNPIIKADAVENCSDISADFTEDVPFSGRPWLLDSFSADQAVLVPNEAYWDTEDAPLASRVVMVPREDSNTEVAALTSGEVEFIFPQAFDGLATGLAQPDIENTPGYGTQYEGLYFGQREGGPFSDPVFREAFAKSIDRQTLFDNIYAPLFPGAELLNCGLWVPTIGEWCDNTQFADFFDPEGAAALLTENGWALNDEGFWADADGTVPEILWVVNRGNERRESTQALMIPLFEAAGFNVVEDNCRASCYFQTRLPALDYDLAMYISVTQPDPTVTNIMACDQIPGPENENRGQNFTGWCNEEASGLMTTSDQNLDEASRIDQIHQIGQLLVDDSVMVPLYQFPNIAAWRTDRLGGPVGDDAANFRAFANNLFDWEPLDDDEIVIGAEQWPACLNPVTECASSSWMVWTNTWNLFPGAFDTTADGTYVVTDLLTGEPTVELTAG